MREDNIRKRSTLKQIENLKRTIATEFIYSSWAANQPLLARLLLVFSSSLSNLLCAQLCCVGVRPTTSIIGCGGKK